MQSRRDFRIGIINVLYKYELLSKPLDMRQIFEAESGLNNEQFKQLELISKNYFFIKNNIEKFLREDYSWERISPLIRAILINATQEYFLIPPKVVVNEAIEITKIYFDDADNYYKVVNAILQNIYQDFVKNEVAIKKDEK